MRRIYYILLFVMLLCVGCEWHMKKHANYSSYAINVERYDILEAKYLRDGDYSALQQMNTDYPLQTHILIEDLLALGKVDDPDINHKFLAFYQDPTLQSIMSEAVSQYANMEDINQGLSESFMRLKALVPDLKIPIIYSQIGALGQSILVSDGLVGISLDKYLGADFPVYANYYPEEQRKSMVRSMIVPDCLGFYLLSNYPNAANDTVQINRTMHKAKIQWVVNTISNKKMFDNENVKLVDRYMKNNSNISVDELLTDDDYTKLLVL